MIRWIVAALGLAYGWEVFGVEIGVVLGIVGFVIGRWFEPSSSAAATPASAPVTSVAAELQQLKRRVSQLEAEVAQLKAAPAAISDTVANPTTPDRAAPEPVAPQSTTASSPPLSPSPVPPIVQPASISTPPSESHDFSLGTVTAPATKATRPQDVRPTASGLDDALQAAKDWLLGGNTVVRLGMLILFFGVSFLLKFAADNQLLPIEARLAGLSLGAAVIFAIGWRLRASRRGYALIMQGGALGLLYFTIYAALKLYHLLPSTVAFALLALLGVAAAILSIKQDASALAVTGIFGGFLAPILTSDGSGNHVLLFSYFALLNAGIFGIAWFKAWRSLNLLGFIFTYVIASSWGVLNYRGELRASTQPFIVIFWLFYAGISTLYALKRSHITRSIVDGTLVFGTPIITLALQSQLMQGTEYGMCYSALIGAAFYLAVAAWLHARRDPTLRLFTETQLALGVLLATLAIPLAFDGNVTAAMWAVEGAAVVWISLRQQRRIALAFGLLLQFAAGLAVISAGEYYTSIPLLNGVYLADLLLALSGLFCAWQLHEKQPDWSPKPQLITVGYVLGAWGLLWWGKGHADEITRFLDGNAVLNAQLVLLAATAAVFQFLHLYWRNARVVALALGPVLLLVALEHYSQLPHFLTLWAWPIVIIALFALLYQQDQSSSPCEAWQHIIAAWLSWGIFINETAYLASQNIPSDVSRLAAFALLTSVAVAAVKYLPWPVKRHWRAYWVYGTAPMALMLFLWGFYSALSGGQSALPLLNALDLAQLAAFAALALWLKHTLAELGISPAPRALLAALGLALFVWLNAMLLRTLHHQAALEYTFEALRHSTLVQMSLSIFWTVIALALMLIATRKALRVLWLIGACLLAIVVVKLFLLDLSHIGGIERIGSFIGVGLLLLLIGYLAPIPPEER